jgi:hypothetical protein
MTASRPMTAARLWFLKPVGKKFPMFTYSCPGAPRAEMCQELNGGRDFPGRRTTHYANRIGFLMGF